MTRRRHAFSRRRTRVGLVLPLVLITLLVVLVLSGGLQTMAWRATRGARSQWDAQRAMFAANATINQALNTWNGESFAQQPIGMPVVRTTNDPSGWETELTVIRTGTLVATASATVTSASSLFLSDPVRVWQRVVTVVRLDPPHFPLLAAATILGNVELQSATFDGRDPLPNIPTAIDDCGNARDTASIGAISVGGTFGTNTPTAYGTLTTLSAPSLQSRRDQFDAAWSVLVSKATITTVSVATTLAPTIPWRALVTRSATPVTLIGASTHVGLLAVDGDLDIQGSLQVDGVLVVRGAITTHGATLHVRGALIVRDVNGLGTRFSPSASVVYAPCAIGRAMSAIATPQFAPFLIWHSP